MTMRSAQIVVIGGGLHGLSAALQLLLADKQVVILERRWVGRHASGATAAGVRTLNRDFRELDLSLESMEMWPRLSELVGDSCGFHAGGQICVAQDEQSLAKLQKRVSTLQARGYTHEEIISEAELRKIIPSLTGPCVGASIARDNGSADPHRMLRAFRDRIKVLGGQIFEQCGVRSLERLQDKWVINTNQGVWQADHIVNTAGAWGAEIAAMVGDNFHIGTKSSMMMATERMRPFITSVVSILGRSLSFKQSDQGTLIIGGGLQGIPNLENETSTAKMSVLSKGARATTDLFPELDGVRIVRVWSGLEATTGDLLPIVGPALNAPNFIHAFGFSGHGFQLVPVMGLVVRDLVLEGKTKLPIGELLPTRELPEPQFP